MKKDQATHDKLKLRKRAEEALQGEPDDISKMSEEKMRHHIQELRIHQIELEMQNEELRRAQLELQAARDKYSDLYDFAPVGYFTISDKGMILEANLTGADMLGVARGLLIGSPFAKFIKRDGQDIFYHHRRQLIETKSKQIFAMRLVKKDGSQFHVRIECIPVLDEVGNFHHIRAVISNISDWKQAEEALRESEEKYRAMMESMNDAVYICSPEFRIEYMNPRMSSRIDHNAVGELCHKAIYDNDDRCPWCVFDRIREGEHVEYEFTNPMDDRYYSIMNSPIFHTGGSVSKLTIFRDQTESKAIEAHQRHVQKLEALGTLAGGTAHEINNPINGIMNYAQLIKDEIGTDNPLIEFADEIINETKRVAVIVRNLLAFAREETKTLCRTSISVIVNSTISLIQTVCKHDQICLEINIPDELPKIKCLDQQIRQVIMNLATNARDALNKKYPGYAKNKKITISACLFEKHGHRQIRTTLEDRGVGIDPAVGERIFDPFFTTQSRATGTGLGLSISYGIIKEHHGELSFESELGQYTKFHMDLPVDDEWELEKNGDSR